LETLFVQAKSKQILEDDWHPGLDDNYQLQSVSPTNPNITDASSFVSFRSHDDEVYDRSHYARWFCQFSPNGKYLASACKKNRLCVWELSTREGKYTWSRVLNEAAHHQSIHLITFSPCSQLVATCSQDQSAKVFMLFPEVKLLYTLKGHQNRICGLGWRLSDATQQVKQKKYFCTKSSFIKLSSTRRVRRSTS
jgi:WD40 repeat protein